MYVLARRRIPVQGVPFVDRIDLSASGNFHVSMSKNELPNRLGQVVSVGV